MLQFRSDIHTVFKQRMGNEVVKTLVCISVFLPVRILGQVPKLKLVLFER